MESILTDVLTRHLAKQIFLKETHKYYNLNKKLYRDNNNINVFMITISFITRCVSYVLWSNRLYSCGGAWVRLIQ